MAMVFGSGLQIPNSEKNRKGELHLSRFRRIRPEDHNPKQRAYAIRPYKTGNQS
jgi:hypothetical protein